MRCLVNQHRKFQYEIDWKLDESQDDRRKEHVSQNRISAKRMGRFSSYFLQRFLRFFGMLFSQINENGLDQGSKFFLVLPVEKDYLPENQSA